VWTIIVIDRFIEVFLCCRRFVGAIRPTIDNLTEAALSTMGIDKQSMITTHITPPASSTPQDAFLPPDEPSSINAHYVEGAGTDSAASASNGTAVDIEDGLGTTYCTDAKSDKAPLMNGSVSSREQVHSDSGASGTSQLTLPLDSPAVADQSFGSIKKRLVRLFARSMSIANAATNSRSSSASIGSSSPGWFRMLIIIGAWYLVSVVAIVTTKLLITEWWQVPPIALTFQQFLLSSTLLRLKLALSGNAQPIVLPGSCSRLLPWTIAASKDDELKDDRAATPALEYVALAGVFNTLDFLFSNFAFGASAASFVETVKSSDPISTTAVSLGFRVDRINSRGEMISLTLLVVGLFVSTWGNSQTEEANNNVDGTSEGMEDGGTEVVPDQWTASARAAAMVVSANFCFAFRAMFQKRYRNRCEDRQARVSSPKAGLLLDGSSSIGSPCVSLESSGELDNENLLCRMQQVGWMCLLFPALFSCRGVVWDTIWNYQSPSSLLQGETLWLYIQVSLLNGITYAVYK